MNEITTSEALCELRNTKLKLRIVKLEAVEKAARNILNEILCKETIGLNQLNIAANELRKALNNC